MMFLLEIFFSSNYFCHNSVLTLYMLSDNTFNQYHENGQVIDGEIQGDQDRGEIIADITSSFVILLAIFFPSCTGRLLSNY